MKKFIYVLTAVALIPVLTHAATNAGDSRIGGNLSYSSPDVGDDSIFLFANYGYFFTAEIEISANVGFIDAGGSDSIIYGAGGKYHFNTDADLVPYVGAGLLVFDSDDFEDETITVSGGLDQFISERTSINYEASYDSESNLRALIGISFYF